MRTQACASIWSAEQQQEQRNNNKHRSSYEYLTTMTLAIQCDSISPLFWLLIENFNAGGSGYVFERRFTKFHEITPSKGHYAVQGHSMLPILAPNESSFTTSYQWLILTYLLSCTVSKLWLIIGQIFASERGMPHLNALARTC